MSNGEETPNLKIINACNFPEAEEMDEAVKIQVVLPALQSRFLQSWKKGSLLT